MKRPRKPTPTTEYIIGAPDRDTPEPDSTTAEQIRVMAARRVPNALQAIKLCGNMANYQLTETQKGAILKALNEAVADVQRRFAINTNKSGITFTLPE